MLLNLYIYCLALPTAGTAAGSLGCLAVSTYCFRGRVAFTEARPDCRSLAVYRLRRTP